MRITILGRDFPPAISGIGDHTDLLAAEVARRGHAVTVICSVGAVVERASFDVRPVVARWDARGHGAIADAVAASEPDVILWQYNPFSVGSRGFAFRVGRLSRALSWVAPLVVLAHELWFPWGRSGLKGLAWAIAHRAQMRSIARAARAVVVTTERRGTELARAARGKTHVVPIAANIEPRGEVADARASLGIPADAFVVAHLGSVGPGRELGPVVEAVAALRADGRDARLLLAGHTGPFRSPASLNGALIATGVLDRERLSEALLAADAYVHPDLVGPAAGRRGSLMAALAHGLPIVSYCGPDHAPQLVDGHNVIITRAEASDVAAALRALAGDPARARMIGERARATYDASFSWQRVGDGVQSVIQEATR